MTTEMQNDWQPTRSKYGWGSIDELHELACFEVSKALAMQFTNELVSDIYAAMRQHNHFDDPEPTDEFKTAMHEDIRKRVSKVLLRYECWREQQHRVY